MSFFRKHQLAVVTIVYWVLLLYMIAALLWWFIALNKQNNAMMTMQFIALRKDDPAYLQKFALLEEARQRKTAQYIGEGVTFLALILIGAVFVYRAVRRQLRVSQQQQNFMMAITHELKTPIAIAKLNLETLQKRKLDQEKQEKLIGNTLQEANRLSLLCNNILITAQLEGGLYKPVKHDLDLSNVATACVNEFKTRFPHRPFITNIEPGLHILGEETLVQILFNNLVENAIKYSPKEAAVQLFIKKHHNKIECSIADEGIGITDEEKKKVFLKFYRTGDELTRKAKGTGLGLYLCKKIADDLNASISITDNQPKGTIFNIRFHLA